MRLFQSGNKNRRNYICCFEFETHLLSKQFFQIRNVSKNIFKSVGKFIRTKILGIKITEIISSASVIPINSCYEFETLVKKI